MKTCNNCEQGMHAFKFCAEHEPSNYRQVSAKLYADKHLQSERYSCTDNTCGLETCRICRYA